MVLTHLEIDEGFAVRELQARVVGAFVTDGRELAFRHARPADRTGTMRGIENDLVAQRQHLLQRIVEQPGDFALAIGIEIGAADIADEQGIAGKHTDRTLGIGRVMEHEGQMVVGVARCFEHANGQLPDFEGIALARGLGIDDIGCGIGAVQDPRAG